MNEVVFIPHIKADQTMEIVRELRKMGLIQGTDFEFRYYQPKWDNFSYEAVSPGGAEFNFREGKWRTYLALKYAC